PMTENRIRGDLTFLTSLAWTSTVCPPRRGVRASILPSCRTDATAIPAAVVTEALINSRRLVMPGRSSPSARELIVSRFACCFGARGGDGGPPLQVWRNLRRTPLARSLFTGMPSAHLIAKVHLGKSPHNPEGQARRRRATPQLESRRPAAAR